MRGLSTMLIISQLKWHYRKDATKAVVVFSDGLSFDDPEKEARKLVDLGSFCAHSQIAFQKF